MDEQMITHPNTKKGLKYIYVAGPYAHPDPVVNTRRACLVGDVLRSAGFAPYVPHTTLLWHAISPHDEQFWYDLDIDWLLKCDALVRIPGESVGSDHEVAIAAANNIPVFFGMQSFLEENSK